MLISVEERFEKDALELLGFGSEGAEYQRELNKIVSSKGSYLPRYMQGDEEKIKRTIMLHSELSRLELPLAPGVYASGEGSRYVELDRGRYLYLTEWIDGVPVRWKVNEDLFAVGKLIARLHKTGFGLFTRTGYRFESCGFAELILEADMMLQLFSDVARHRVDRGAVDRLFLELVGYFRGEVSETARMFESLTAESERSRRESLSFKRLVDGLIIIEEVSREAVITDCTLLGRDNPVYDLVRIIWNAEEGLWDFAGTEVFLEGYRSVMDLEKEDMRLLHALLRFPYRFYLTVSDYYYNRRTSSEAELLKRVGGSMDEERLRAGYLERFSNLY